jgi:molecular chaperone GrpE
MKDKYLRIYAEFDNYRKRTIKEKEDLIKVASQASIKAILPTLDDFERAIRAAQEAQGEALPEGVLLIYEKLLRNLEAQGLKAMESTGQVFNPDLHEALTNVSSPSEEMKGKVLDTVEKGYYLNDKIIRYAKVVVAQ